MIYTLPLGYSVLIIIALHNLPVEFTIINLTIFLTYVMELHMALYHLSQLNLGFYKEVLPIIEGARKVIMVRNHTLYFSIFITSV